MRIAHIVISTRFFEMVTLSNWSSAVLRKQQANSAAILNTLGKLQAGLAYWHYGNQGQEKDTHSANVNKHEWF